MRCWVFAAALAVILLFPFQADASVQGLSRLDAAAPAGAIVTVANEKPYRTRVFKSERSKQRAAGNGTRTDVRHITEIPDKPRKVAQRQSRARYDGGGVKRDRRNYRKRSVRRDRGNRTYQRRSAKRYDRTHRSRAHYRKRQAERHRYDRRRTVERRQRYNAHRRYNRHRYDRRYYAGSRGHYDRRHARRHHYSNRYDRSRARYRSYTRRFTRGHAYSRGYDHGSSARYGAGVRSYGYSRECDCVPGYRGSYSAGSGYVHGRSRGYFTRGGYYVTPERAEGIRREKIRQRRKMREFWPF